jgi:quercetin dioxygenase-like cupin family protein
MDGRPDCLVHLKDDIEIITTDGVFIKGMAIPTRGLVVQQHKHAYAHTSLVAKGCVRVWTDDPAVFTDYRALESIFIAADTFHKIQALTDDCLVFCIHNISQTNGKVEISEEVKGGG